VAVIRTRSFPLLISKTKGFAVDEGISSEMGKLLCALTMHHGERLMNDEFDEEELPIDYIHRTEQEIYGPEFYACIKRIVTRVVPDYTLLNIYIQDSRNKKESALIIGLSFAELEDKVIFKLDNENI